MPPKSKLALTTILVGGAILLPLLHLDEYWMENVDLAIVYVLLVLSLNLVYGLAGQISLGHAGLFAVGAYTSAILTVKYHQPFLIGFLGAIVAGLAAGLAIGGPALRLRGHYLAFATLGFGSIVQLLAINLPSLTGGSDGFVMIPAPNVFGWQIDTVWKYYYLLLIIMILIVIMNINIRNSRLGRALIALREDELAAQQVGVNTALLKIFTFVVSAGIAALSGSLYAHLFTFISPDVFSLGLSVQLLIMMIVGGVGTISGSIIGAVLVSILPEVLRFSQAYYGVIFGIAVVLLITVMPDGIIGGMQRVWMRFRGS